MGPLKARPKSIRFSLTPKSHAQNMMDRQILQVERQSDAPRGRDALPQRAAVDCPIMTSGAAPLIVDGFRRVRRSTFTEGAITERAEYHRVETSSAGRAGAHRPSEAQHPTRSSEVLPRIARERVRERVPTVPQVAKTRRNGPRRIGPTAHFERNDVTIIYTRASSPRWSLYARIAAPIQDYSV
jgi:hypothetical protein